MHIYKFTHIASSRAYIGQTIQDPTQRRAEHISNSKHTPKTYHFHNALKKYGINAFTFEVIAKASTLEELNNLEEMYIVQFNSIANGFNIRNGGNNKTHHADSIKRMSEAQTAAHARRREQAGGVEKTKPHKKHASGWDHPSKGKETKKWDHKGTLGWKLVDGTRVWYNKEAAV